MCDQVVCEVPEECVGTANACAATPMEQCGDYCPPQCNPCQAPAVYPPCPPSGQCNCRCDCGDYSSCCYQQPPRTLPIRPLVSICTPKVPIDTDTIYKRSYVANCGDCYRARPIMPCNLIPRDRAPIEKCTIQKLSYMPNCGVPRITPIKPKENYLDFRGPLYAMTSQKHDFVPKGYCRRSPIKPPEGICRPCASLEKRTINRLSYMPVDVCKYPPPKPMIQGYHYCRPTAPGEQCTIQKLSYLPLCLPAKERYPWAETHRCVPPKYENLCTTYNLSYIPNCNIGRIRPICPAGGIKHFGSDRNDNSTVYKLSYLGPAGNCCKPPPILPMNGLCMPTGPMEKCTVQKLSYQPNNCIPRTPAVRPKENYLKPAGPQYFMTTQKHDFVAKPVAKRCPMIQYSAICRPTVGIEKCTINKLSYMPVNVCEHRRPKPIMPAVGICRPKAPIEQCTTYKLSYLPNCIAPKEHLPWARADNYVKPTSPIEKCTIQKLSYGPPGQFNRCGGGCNKNAGPCPYPKAGICQ